MTRPQIYKAGAVLVVAVVLWWVLTRGDDRAVEGDVDFSEFTVRGRTYADTSKETE